MSDNEPALSPQMGVILTITLLNVSKYNKIQYYDIDDNEMATSESILGSGDKEIAEMVSTKT